MGNIKNTQRYIHVSIASALQGLAFWISYRQVLCHEHPINEGALVAEFVLLLRAKLDSDFAIFNESGYDECDKKRMDIEIVEKNSKARIAIIEVKRLSAGKTAIDEDVKKLINAKKKNKDAFCYLAVISEKEIPKSFVDKNGKAIRNLSFEENFSANIKILKSTGAFKGKGKDKIPNANYCCLLKISHSPQ